MSRTILLIAMLGGLAGLAGCSHSCVPPGWYDARAVAPPRQPPNAKPIHHNPDYDIPGKAPMGKPSHDEACLVNPPKALTASAAASVASPAKKQGKGGS